MASQQATTDSLSARLEAVLIALDVLGRVEPGTESTLDPTMSRCQLADIVDVLRTSSATIRQLSRQLRHRVMHRAFLCHYCCNFVFSCFLL